MTFHFFTLFITIVALCLPCVIGIVGGGPVDLQPAYVRVEAFDLFCGGTLVAHDMVLTAAHCLYGDDSKPVSSSKVRVVKSDFTSPDWISFAKHFSCRRFIIHHSYEKHLGRPFNPYNLAILELDFSVDLAQPENAILKPCVSWPQSTALKFGAPQFGYAVGMGSFRRIAMRESYILKGVTLVYEPQCDLVYDRMPVAWKLLKINKQNHICYKSKDWKGSTCMGDSGGPILHREKGEVMCVIGVDIYGDVVCNPTLPNVFIRVEAFQDWINQTISTLSKCLTFEASQTPCLKSIDAYKLW